MGGSDRGPVVKPDSFVVVIVRVVVSLPDVILLVDVILVHVVSHVDVREGVLQLGVVVPWDGREWVEEVWVHFLSLHHVLKVLVELCLFLLLCVWNVTIEVSTCKNGVSKKVSVVVHASEDT